MQHVSIKFRLSLAFYLFLFLVIFLGVFSIASLTDFNSVADQIRNRWLPSTRFLGDLNNYTSDFRAAEGTLLLSSTSKDIDDSVKEMAELDRNIAAAQRGYEHIAHDDKEIDLYRHFSDDWNNYRKIVDHMLALVRANDKDKGIAIYKTISKTAYDTTSDTLGLLTDVDIVKDQQASDRAAEAYRHVRFLTVLVIVLAVMLVIIGIIYIRRSISAPMLDLAGSMHRLASHESRDIEVDATVAERQDEVGEMARALVVFRHSMVELAHSRQGLIQQATMLEEKLQHEQELMAMQRNFISIASHEFRTPLSIIDGHAQRFIKMKDQLPPEQIEERAGKIRSAVVEMTSLIDNLINSTRLFDGQPELYFHPAEMDLASVLHKVCSEHQEIAPAIKIDLKIMERSLKMVGDAKLLMQMFGNLLSNAVKYSAAGGKITVSATRDSGLMIVKVQDHGIGIPKKDIAALFERYFRGSNVSDISGTGIGLYLARMVTTLHNGTIKVESVEGEGAVFTVCL